MLIFLTKDLLRCTVSKVYIGSERGSVCAATAIFENYFLTGTRKKGKVSSMVHLDNPYPALRPRPAAFIPLVLLYIAGYLCFSFHAFSFIYQYTLTIVFLVFSASFFDRELLSRARLFSLPGKRNPHLVFILLLAALVVFLYAEGKLLSRNLLVRDFYLRGTQGLRTEHIIVLLFIAVPFEEIFFKAYAQRNLMNLLGRIPGWVLCAFACGLFFLLSGNRNLALKMTLTALCVGYIYHKTDSIPQVVTARVLLTGLALLLPL